MPIDFAGRFSCPVKKIYKCKIVRNQNWIIRCYLSTSVFNVPRTAFSLREFAYDSTLLHSLSLTRDTFLPVFSKYDFSSIALVDFPEHGKPHIIIKGIANYTEQG